MSRTRTPVLYGITRATQQHACPSDFTGRLLRSPCPDCGHTLFVHDPDHTCLSCTQQATFERQIKRMRRHASRRTT